MTKLVAFDIEPPIHDVLSTGGQINKEREKRIRKDVHSITKSNAIKSSRYSTLLKTLQTGTP